jgi:hypothetical protein
MAWNHKFQTRSNQRHFTIALESKRKRDLLVTAFSTWRSSSLLSRAIEVESIIRSNHASSHLNKGTIVLSNHKVKLSSVFHQWRSYHLLRLAKSLRVSKSIHFSRKHILLDSIRLWRCRALHNSWTNKSARLANALYAASSLRRMFQIWKGTRDWSQVIQHRIQTPLLFWACWRRRQAFDKLVKYTRIRKEEKILQEKIDACRRGMLRRIGVRGILIAADARWEKRVANCRGMDERKARIGLKYGMRWKMNVFAGRRLTCMSHVI